MAEWEWLLHEVKKFLDHILRHTHRENNTNIKGHTIFI